MSKDPTDERALFDRPDRSSPRAPGTWQRYCPNRSWRNRALRAMEADLDRPEMEALLRQLERDETYPTPVLDRLRELGLSEFYAPDMAASHPPAATLFHLCSINAMLARRSGSVAITVGVNGLALLPAYLAGTDAQLEALFDRFRAGHFCSMLLTELAHGSNLLRNEARAEALHEDARGELRPCSNPNEATHFRLYGDKQLINGGHEHGTLVALMRTAGFDKDPRGTRSLLGDGGDFTCLYLSRQPGVESLPRWRTLPMPAADISGVRFDGVTVPASQVIGGVGHGFGVVQRTLTVSRGTICALASGLVANTRDLAVAYLARRNVYGESVASLTGLVDHLRTIDAHDRAVAAISLKAMVQLNADGEGAAYYTAVAKYIGCRLAEEAVTQGQRVLGARSLLASAPYAGLVGDVLLYGVFDGMSHVMLEQVATYLLRHATRHSSDSSSVDDALCRLKTAYAQPATPIVRAFRQRGRDASPTLGARLRALESVDGALDLGALSLSTETLYALVRAWNCEDLWRADQALRFEAAHALCLLEVATALVELFDSPRRSALGIVPAYAREGLDVFEELANRSAMSVMIRRATRAIHTLAIENPLESEWVPSRVAAAGGLVGLVTRAARDARSLRSAFAQAVATLGTRLI